MPKGDAAQCSRGWWTPERRKAHGERIRESQRYKAGIAVRNTSGERNSMFGKTLTAETRAKMSEARRGKVGAQATAWKGGSQSVLRRLKRMLTHRRWFQDVLGRAKGQCEKCPARAVDAHHIVPLATIVRRLTAGRVFNDDDAKLNWLIQQDEVLDPERRNGMALCRPCHRNEHGNSWGSHVQVR